MSGSTTTRPFGAPTLPELREILAVSLRAYPELRRGLTQAQRQVEAVLDGKTPRRPGRNRRRVEGLRS